MTVTCIDLCMGQCAPGNMLIALAKGMIVGAFVGYTLGHGMSFIMRRIRLEADGLYSVLVISMTLIVYSAAEHLGGNCFLAVYISAMVLAIQLAKRWRVKPFVRNNWGLWIVVAILTILATGFLTYNAPDWIIFEDMG